MNTVQPFCPPPNTVTSGIALMEITRLVMDWIVWKLAPRAVLSATLSVIKATEVDTPTPVIVLKIPVKTKYRTVP